ncbi:MAG TPA: matrixin family metalloprotease [Chthoniobacterales bacterium]|nr:matrixin family metalloprotease [Chthoniobacterales bacterium]
MRNRPFLAATALFLLASVLPSFGFIVTGQSWTRNRTVVMHLSLPPGSGTFQDGFNSLGESAEDALNIWNQHLAHMHFGVDRNSILPPESLDGDTSVFMSNTVYGDPFGGNTLAVTLISARGSMFEADVIFNNAFAFDSYRGNLQPGLQDFHRVALHEFGHVLGLGHPNQGPPPQTVMAIMNSTIGNIDSLQPDDIAGAQSIYSNGPPYLTANPSSNLVNLSTRAFVSTGENALIGGFIIQGSQPATVILRAIGHSLRAFGINNPLTDPIMELHGSSGIIATSDDWIDSSNATTIASYGLDPANSLESAIIATLNPGNYTVIVRAFDNQDGDLTGVGLVELYDLHTNNGRAGNISTRAQVQTGENVLIGGFIVGGSQGKEVVVRGIGPSLAGAGIANPLGDPTLELYNGAGTLISSNNDWANGPDAGTIQARGLAPTQPAESALLATLNPGNYTAIVRGVNNTTGVAVVEAYDLSPPP